MITQSSLTACMGHYLHTLKSCRGDGRVVADLLAQQQHSSRINVTGRLPSCCATFCTLAAAAAAAAAASPAPVAAPVVGLSDLCSEPDTAGGQRTGLLHHHPHTELFECLEAPRKPDWDQRPRAAVRWCDAATRQRSQRKRCDLHLYLPKGTVEAVNLMHLGV